MSIKDMEKKELIKVSKVSLTGKGQDTLSPLETYRWLKLWKIKVKK